MLFKTRGLADREKNEKHKITAQQHILFEQNLNKQETRERYDVQ